MSLRVLGHAVSGLLLPPVLLAAALAIALLLAGFPRTDVLGVFAHLIGADLEVGLAEVDDPTRVGADAAWFAAASETLERMGFATDATVAIERGGYRSVVRAHPGDPDDVLAFTLQTVYPGAPPPSLHFWSPCGEVWVETADEIEPPEDGGHPPFLKLELRRDLDPEALLARHRERLGELCTNVGAATVDGLRAFLLRDRSWWFEHCAGDLVGMTRACPQP